MKFGKKEEWVNPGEYMGYTNEWLIEDFLGGDYKLPEDVIPVYVMKFKNNDIDYFCNAMKCEFGHFQTKAYFSEMDEYAKNLDENMFSDEWETKLKAFQKKYFEENGDEELFCKMPEGENKNKLRETVLNEINSRWAYVYTIKEILAFNPVPVSESSSMVIGYQIRGVTKQEANLMDIFRHNYPDMKTDEIVWYVVQKTPYKSCKDVKTIKQTLERVPVSEINTIIFRDSIRYMKYNKERSTKFPFFEETIYE